MRKLFAVFVSMICILNAIPAMAAAPSEKDFSEILDIWREGRYEQLYDRTYRRGKTSREKFVEQMRASTVKPSCCWQKLQGFRVVSERRTESTVYAKIGLEGSGAGLESSSRDYEMGIESGIWKMRMSDVLDLSEAGSKRKKARKHK